MKIRNILLYCMLFMLLLSLAFSADKPWLSIFPGGQDYSSIALLVALTLMIAAGVVAIIYMFAIFVNNEPMKASAKMELFEIFYSAVIFMMLFSLFPMFDTAIGNGISSIYKTETNLKIAALSVSPETGYSLLPVHFRYSKYFLQSLFNEATKFNAEVFESYSITGILGDIYLSLDLFWEQRGFITYNPMKGFFHMGNVIKMQVFDLVAKVAILSKFQEIFLHVFVSGFFPMFLAVGTILRSFKLTRKLGGLMMAIAVALYFIFPLCYVFAGSIYDNTGGVGSFHIDMSTVENLVNPFGKVTPLDSTQEMNLEGKTPEELETLLEGMGKDDVCNLLSGENTDSAKEAEDIQASIKEWSDRFQNQGLNVPFTSDAYFIIPGRMIFFSMFFSFFGLMATIAAIRSFSAVFGGDMEIAGLTHLI